MRSLNFEDARSKEAQVGAKGLRDFVAILWLVVRSTLPARNRVTPRVKVFGPDHPPPR